MIEQVEPNYEVHKFGGAAQETTDRILASAADIASIVVDQQKRILIVVSAQGKTTNDLLERIRGLNPNLALGHEAVDAMLSAGEMQSAALMLAALHMHGVQDAVIMAPNQLPMELADGENGLNAGLVQSIDGTKFLNTFEKNRVIVAPGFLGTDKDGRVRTMGRGGSDLSAVVFAYAIQKILGRKIPAIFEKEVAGVLRAPPNLVKLARAIEFIKNSDCARLLEASDHQFIAPRAAAAADDLDVRMIFRQAACFLPPGETRAFSGTIIDARRDDTSIETARNFRALAARIFTAYNCSDEDQGTVLDALEAHDIASQDTKENSRGGGHKIIVPHLKPEEDATRHALLAELPLTNKRDVAVMRLFLPELLEARRHITAKVRRIMTNIERPFVVSSEEQCVIIEVNTEDSGVTANALAQEFDLCEKEAA